MPFFLSGTIVWLRVHTFLMDRPSDCLHAKMVMRVQSAVDNPGVVSDWPSSQEGEEATAQAGAPHVAGGGLAALQSHPRNTVGERR